jgi:hypothetical protein
MRNILVILLTLIVSGCQALTATTSVIAGSVACSSSEKEQSFPPEGSVKEIDLSFTITDTAKDISFSETAICEYQGSMCGGGAWFEVWYGDQSLSHEIPLPSGDELIFRPHSFCTSLDEYRKKCNSGSCDPNEHFTLLLMFSEKRKSGIVVEGDEWAKGKLQDRALVKASDLPKYGYEVKHFNIEVASEAYNKSFKSAPSGPDALAGAP